MYVFKLNSSHNLRPMQPLSLPKMKWRAEGTVDLHAAVLWKGKSKHTVVLTCLDITTLNAENGK